MTQRQWTIVQYAMLALKGDPAGHWDIHWDIDEDGKPPDGEEIDAAVQWLSDHVAPPPPRRASPMAVIAQAVEGLREYYPGLSLVDVAGVAVPDTGNAQSDYETVRDEVEKIARTLYARRTEPAPICDQPGWTAAMPFAYVDGVPVTWPGGQAMRFDSKEEARCMEQAFAARAASRDSAAKAESACVRRSETILGADGQPAIIPERKETIISFYAYATFGTAPPFKKGKR